jgi:LPS export ABC transporter protein LptC
MSDRKKKIQIVLLLFGLILIFSTYFLYPKVNQKKLLESKIDIKKPLKVENKQSNVFENVSYEGFYNVINPFTIKSDNAYILDEEPDIVYMKKMHVIIYMNNGSVINIRSDKGRYNKTTYDCFFEDNVKANDEETQVYADNLDLLASDDLASVYNNVYVTNDKSYLKADKIDYNFEKKNYYISMFSDKRIKIKLTE